MTAPTDPREAHRPDDGCYDGSWEHALGVLRHRHANIAGTDPANGAPIRLCAADREAWPCQTVEALDLAASRLAARQDEPSPALRDALADLRAAVELCDARVHDTWGRGAMADFYTFRAADWNRVVAVARGHLSESALRQITHARTALAANPPQTREVYQSEFGMVDENDAIPPQTREAEGAAQLPDAEAASYIEDRPEAWAAWLAGLRRYAPQLPALTSYLGTEAAAIEVIGGSILAYLASSHDLGLFPFGARAARTPEAQRDAEPPAMTGSITERHSGDIGGQRDAGNRGIDAERLQRAIAAHAESHKTHSRTHVRATCAADIVAEYRATQPPAAGTEGTETGGTP